VKNQPVIDGKTNRNNKIRQFANSPIRQFGNWSIDQEAFL